MKRLEVTTEKPYFARLIVPRAVQMRAAYSQRPVAIQRCIDETSERVRQLKEKRDTSGGEDAAVNRALRKEQTKVNRFLFLLLLLLLLLLSLTVLSQQLRLMQSELGVESVVKERSIKVGD